MDVMFVLGVSVVVEAHRPGLVLDADPEHDAVADKPPTLSGSLDHDVGLGDPRNLSDVVELGAHGLLAKYPSMDPVSDGFASSR